MSTLLATAVNRRPMRTPTIRVRLARHSDLPAIRALTEQSVRTLCADDYSPEQVRSLARQVAEVDAQLIDDHSYFVVEIGGALAGCGGWSFRESPHPPAPAAGGRFLDPVTEPAQLRAFYVHPDFARRGIASMLLDLCESVASDHGFRRIELWATRTGAKFYAARGYRVVETIEVRHPDGLTLSAAKMAKRHLLK
jgi:GNAT superfamily N-acetyltransferase